MPSINHFVPCQENSDSLPPLPKKVLAKIRQGKFIDFDMLLTQAFPPSTTDISDVSINHSIISKLKFEKKSSETVFRAS